jgi:Protein of unknown function (DUF4240)
MDEATFWHLIEECDHEAHGDMVAKDRLVALKIAQLTKNDALKFYQIFEQMMDAAYTWPLWGAAHILNGGCGDDSFADFRAALISRGSASFQSALADPDSLADENVDLENWFHEGFEFALADAVRANIGRPPTRANPIPQNPSGHPWNEPTVYSHYPKLVLKMGSLL